MTITLDLPQELENALSTGAKEFGVSLQEYLLHVLYTSLSVGNLPKTGAELVEYWRSEKLIGTRPDIIDSQTHARQLRSQAELSPHEKARKWEEWAASHSFNQAVILDDSREVIYGNEER